MKKTFIFLCIYFFYVTTYSQSIGIGTATPDASSILDITNTTKGLLIPRMTTTAITSIASPAKGLLVYDTLLNQLKVNMGTASSPNWQTIVAKSGWGLNGNSGTNPSTQFIGNTDNQSLKFRINNIVAGELNPSGNIFLGMRAGQSNTNGYGNLGMGTDALRLNTGGLFNTAIGDSAMFNSNGDPGGNGYNWSNTAVGFKALYANTTGSYNAAVGLWALLSNTIGGANTAIGTGTLTQNTTGNDNTATGSNAMSDNTTGSENIATGTAALFSNTTGSSNVAIGAGVLFDNTTASNNTATGYNALRFNVDGSDNTATGYKSQYQNVSGIYNVSDGFQSLLNNVSGEYNTAIGTYALENNNGSLGSFNTAVGGFTLFKTSNSQNNTVVGYNAGSLYDLGYNNTILGANCDAAFAGAYNDIAIGQGVVCTDNSQARIGNSATYSIGGYANWSNISDGRYKKNLKEDVKGLEFIMKLRPVTYNLDITALSKRLNVSQGKETTIAMQTAMAEKEKVIQTGFVAQEVEQAANETGYNFSGVDKPRTDSGLYGLRYAEFVVPLVKAVQEQQEEIDLLKQQNELFLKRLEALENKNQ